MAMGASVLTVSWEKWHGLLTLLSSPSASQLYGFSSEPQCVHV